MIFGLHWQFDSAERWQNVRFRWKGHFELWTGGKNEIEGNIVEAPQLDPVSIVHVHPLQPTWRSGSIIPSNSQWSLRILLVGREESQLSVILGWIWLVGREEAETQFGEASPPSNCPWRGNARLNKGEPVREKLSCSFGQYMARNRLHTKTPSNHW